MRIETSFEEFGLKIGNWGCFNEYMRIFKYMYKRSRSFFDHCPRSLLVKQFKHPKSH